MKIYHADIPTEVVLRYRMLQPDKKLRVLISYGRRDKHSANFLGKQREHLNGLILDSGTWTLNTDRRKHSDKITFNGYLAYLRIFSGKVDFYFNFDEDFSSEGFETNYAHQLHLERAGLKPVPVIHNCYNNEIKTYIERGYDLVSIGSGELKYASLDDLRPIVNQLYNAGVKVHFLGCTRYEKLAYLPVYSCDSSTWGYAGPTGRILYWNTKRAGFNKTDKIVLDASVPKRLVKHDIHSYPYRRDLDRYLDQELGLAVDDLMGPEKLMNRAMVNIHYFVLLEEIINAKHEEQGFRL